MSEKEVLLVVDLRDVTPYQRQHFQQEMYDRDWQPIEGERGLYAAFPETTTDSGIVRLSEGEVSEAAEVSGVQDWDAVCVLA